MNSHDFKKLVAVGEFIKTLPLRINHKARTANDMRLALKSVAKDLGGEIDVIMVDFLTKMASSRGSKYESVSYNANCLAEFAVEFNSAVICFSQFSREITKRDGGESKVKLSDFRDSGEIEELGRTVFGLWGSDETNGLRDVQLACLKQGEGMTFDANLVFNTDLMTFGPRTPVMFSGT
jgi:replicative DNA helicase